MNPYASSVSVPLRPHRSALVFTFGLLGLLVCFIFGIFAWVWGRADLAEMKAGRMQTDDGLTNAGYVLGMISCILALLGLAVGVVVLIIFALGASAL